MSASHFASTSQPRGPSWPLPKPKILPIVKVVNETYQGPAPQDKDLVQLYMTLPTKKSPMYIDPSDTVVKKSLDTIRGQYKVWINVDDGGDCFVIEGASIQNISAAMREIREFLHLQAKALEGTATVMAHRIGGSQSNIELKRIVQVAGARFGLPEGSWRGVALPGTTEEHLAELIKVHMVSDLFASIQKAVRSLRPDVGQKYVRVHLGLRTLSKKVKPETVGLEGTLSNKENSEPLSPFDPEALKEYNTPQYESLLSSATKRGHSYFNLCFGGESLTQTVLHHIHKTDHGEVPGSKYLALEATVGRLEDVKPQFTLVFFSHGYRIEMDLHFESKYAPAPTIATTGRSQPLMWNKPTASTPRVFRFNKMVDAEVIIPCPDMKVDWQITVESDLGTGQIYDQFRALATELRFDNVPDGNLTFPTVFVTRAAFLRANIDGIAMKVYRTFECAKAPFHVQVATYYDWNAAPLPQYLAKQDIMEYQFGTEQGSKCPLPNKSCAVTLYGSEWDVKMQDMNPASIDFSADLMKIFCDQRMLEDSGALRAGELYTGKLLREVEALLDITTQAAAELETLETLEGEIADLRFIPASPTTQAASVLNHTPTQVTQASSVPGKVAIQAATQAVSLLDIENEAITVPTIAPAQDPTKSEYLIDMHSECIPGSFSQPPLT